MSPDPLGALRCQDKFHVHARYFSLQSYCQFSCDVATFQNLKLPFLLRFKFHQIIDPIETWRFTTF